MKSVFDYHDYRQFLLALWGGERRRTGQRAEAARALACHSTFLSHVLHGKADFSLEQAERLAEHLALHEDERHYFLLLVQKERAGTRNLRRYFEKQLASIQEARRVLANRVPANDRISREDEEIFYSSWIYGAVHVLVSIPELCTGAALARHLRVSTVRIAEVLDFLVRIGLLDRDGDQFRTGSRHVHLAGDSKSIGKHHANWRLRAIAALDERKPEDLHYSAVATLSKKDAEKVRELLLAGLRTNLELISASKEEEAYVYCFDFFPLGRN